MLSFIQKPMVKKIRKFAIILIILGLLIYWLFIAGHQQSNQLPGYIEGDLVYIKPQVNGQLLHWQVTKGEQITSGETLFTIDPSTYRYQQQEAQAALNAAEANYKNLLTGKRESYLNTIESQIEQAQAQEALDKITYQRDAQLYHQASISAQEFDQAKSAYDAAKANVAALQQELVSAKLPARDQEIANAKALVKQQQAALQLAHWYLQQTTVKAPLPGTLFDVYSYAGEQLTTGEPVASILNPTHVHLVFYIPEKSLSSLHLGQTIQFDVDGASHAFDAKISYISAEAAYTPPVLYSQNSRQELSYKIEAVPLQTTHTTQRWQVSQPVSVTVPGVQLNG